MASSRRWLALPAVLVLGCGPQETNQAPSPPRPFVGGDTPLHADRLKNVWLVSVGDDASLEWVFHESGFFVDSGKSPLPEDLSALLLAANVKAARIEGAWRLDLEKSELVLSDLQGGDRPGPKSAVLPISPAGAVRINLGERQYNLLPLEKRR